MKLVKKLLLPLCLLLTFQMIAQDQVDWYRDLAFKYHNLGIKNVSQGAKGIKHFETSIYYREKTLKKWPEDSLLLSNSYHNIGYIHSLMQNFNPAINYLDKAFEIRNNYLDKCPEYALSTYRGKADLYYYIGDYKRAEEYYLHYITLARNINYRRSILGSLQNLANTYLDMGNFHQATEYFTQLLPAATGSSLAQVNFQLGDAFGKLDSLDQAMPYTLDAIEYARATKDSLLLSRALVSISVLQKKKKDYLASTNSLKESIAILKNMDLAPATYEVEITRSYHNLGDVYSKQARMDSALYFYDASILNFFPSKNFRPPLDSLASYIQPDVFLTYQQSRGIHLLKQYIKTKQKALLTEALATFLYCEKIIKKLRLLQRNDLSKLIWQEETRLLYESGIEAALLAGRDELALRFAENAKASLLLESLNQIEANKIGNIPAIRTEEEKRLKIEVIQLEGSIRNERNDSMLQVLKQELFEAKSTLADFQRKLEKDFPRYYQAKFDTTIVGTSQIKAQLLDEKTALIEYVVSDSTIFIFCVDQAGLRTYQRKWTAALEEDFTTLLDFLTTNGTNYDDYVRIGQTMYDSLLSPALTDLKGIEKLIIIPDNFLAYLPFETLLTGQVAEGPKSYRNLPYLFRDYAVAYGYSANVLIKNQQPTASKKPKVLALAPTFGKDRGVLPNARGEAEDILGLFPGKLLPGDSATRKNLLEQAKNFDILYFSTHATAGRKNELDNCIFLSQGDSLSLNEVQYLALENINTRMIVLSACETGRGELLRGEGVWSMGRSFSTIGIPSVSMSLWRVDDERTRFLMKQYFSSLKDGYGKAESLQRARKTYFSDDDAKGFHPYYWAAFVNYGDDGALVQPWSFWWLLPVFLGLGFVARRLRESFKAKQASIN